MKQKKQRALKKEAITDKINSIFDNKETSSRWTRSFMTLIQEKHFSQEHISQAINILKDENAYTEMPNLLAILKYSKKITIEHIKDMADNSAHIHERDEKAYNKEAFPDADSVIVDLARHIPYHNLSSTYTDNIMIVECLNSLRINCSDKGATEFDIAVKQSLEELFIGKKKKEIGSIVNLLGKYEEVKSIMHQKEKDADLILQHFLKTAEGGINNGLYNDPVGMY